MIVLGYILSTIIAIFFVGAYAPIAGIIIGFFIHILVLLTRISKRLENLSDELAGIKNS